MNIEFTPAIEQCKLYPPEPIKNFLPEWFINADISPPGCKLYPSAKEMLFSPKMKAGTIKKCIPAVDYMTSGYLIRNFLDISFTQEMSEDKGEEIFFYHNTRLAQPFVDKHIKQQFPGIPKYKEVMKITGVWGIKTPPGYSSLIYQPFYNLENRWQFLPAIVDTDSYTNPISLPFIFQDLKNGESINHFMEAGTPLVCVFPFKREKWTGLVNEYTIQNDQSRITILTQLNNLYKRFFHKTKRYY